MIKFTKKGSVSLHVSVIEAAAGGGARLRFEVRDTGIGIAEADRAKIFEGFSQLDSSNTRIYGGTGLGLSICHRVAIMMGGTIGLESVLGEGSVFRFEIPCKPALAEKGPALVADLSRTRIVMTGTALSERQSLIEGLQDGVAKAEIVSSTRDALDRLQAMVDEGARRPVVIYAAESLADDAAEFARRVKANRAFENCPLILLIRSGLRGDAAHSKSLGFSAYLGEPLDAEIMLRCLRYFENEMDIGREKSAELITIHSLKEAIGRVPIVLIAEDHPVNQKLAVALMQRLGCSTVIVDNGAEAVERVKAGGIDMVLMDVQMPVMDGISATRAIRELGDAAAWLPIIAVTAHALAGDEEKYKAAGMDDFVPKPIEPERLKNTMLHWLRRTTEPGLGAGSARLGAAHGLPVLDQAVLDTLERSLGKAGVIELARAYMETTVQHLDALDRAIAAGDTVKVGAEVHDLKSSSGNLGARQLAAQARAIQAAVKSEPLPAIRDLMIPLRAQFDAARKAFGERYRA
ncbi:MAG: response regulator [Alphaproteobacteria bacterium]|nr:response regulator [Alphaproteobacteria bacterium]